MYASNEDEDWVYLQKTPPVNTILHRAVTRGDHERSSSSSSNSSSSISDRSVSLSSIYSTDLEHDVSLLSINNSMNHCDLEHENHLLETINLNDPVLLRQLISTPTVNEKEISPSEITIPHTAATNENDLLNTGFELSKTFSLTNSNESLSLPNSLRRRIGVNAQQTDLYNSEVIQSTPISQDVQSRKRFERHENTNKMLISCTCFIVLAILPFILGQVVTKWDQPTMNQIAKDLAKTNQRLNEIKDIPIGNFAEKLTNQLEEKIQNMINQQLTWHEHEKSAFILRIRDLRETLNTTQQNLTKTVHQLTGENRRLQEHIRLLERRLEVTEKRFPKDKKTCLEGVNCSKSTFDRLVSNILKQTASIATDTSLNLSGLFEHLSASVSNIVDHRHEYIKESKRKLTTLAGSSTAEKVQMSIRHSVENLSSSFRKAKSTYATWVKSRAKARMENNAKTQQQTPKKYPWRWTFQRGYNRDSIRYQTANKEQVCYSKFYFPLNKICSMKNWMVKLFRL